jgi:hypothetical protein
VNDFSLKDRRMDDGGTLNVNTRGGLLMDCWAAHLGHFGGASLLFGFHEPETGEDGSASRRGVLSMNIERERKHQKPSFEDCC